MNELEPHTPALTPTADQADIDRRLALHWLLNPNTAPLSSFNEEVQRLVAVISDRLPTRGLDATTKSLIDETARKEKKRKAAAEYADYLEAREEGSRLHKARNSGPPSWAPVSLDNAWNAVENEAQTEVGCVSGELAIGLFYSGKVNGVHAESEAGKSWLSTNTAVQEIKRRRRVVYVDFEDDAASILRRVKLLGATKEEVLAYFTYRNPTGPLTDVEMRDFNSLVNMRGSLVVFDGMTEAMAAEGLNGQIAEDVAAWHAKYTKPFAASQWAVLVLDHVPHEGKRALGSQHKKSALTGVSYLLESVAPIGKGLVGRSRLKVEKDRGAWIRAHAVPGKTPQWFADFVIDFEGKSQPTVGIWLGVQSSQQGEGKGYESEPPERLRTAVRAFVKENPGCSITAIRRGVKGGNADIDWTREWLIDHGQLDTVTKGQMKAHYVPDSDPAGTLP